MASTRRYKSAINNDASTRVLAGFLYGVKATDPSTLITFSLLIGAVTLAATYIPAPRAIRVDPLVTLRQE